MAQGCHLRTWLPVTLGILLLDPKVRLGEEEASVAVLQKWAPLEGESFVAGLLLTWPCLSWPFPPDV